jgi:hypothetical protein
MKIGEYFSAIEKQAKTSVVDFSHAVENKPSPNSPTKSVSQSGVTKTMPQKTQKSLSISVAPADVPTLDLDASEIPLRAMKVGVPFTGQLYGKGGKPPYRFELTSGALPDGLKLSLDGLITGTPTKDSNFSPVIAVMDSSE